MPDNYKGNGRPDLLGEHARGFGFTPEMRRRGDDLRRLQRSKRSGAVTVNRTTVYGVAPTEVTFGAAGYPIDVGDTEADGTATTVPRSDHRHAHGSRTNSTAHRDEDIDVTGMKQTILLTAGGGAPTTTAGCAAVATVEAATNDVDYKVLDFDQTTKEYAFWGPIALPDNYDGGTLTARFRWTAAAGAASAGVRWGIQLICRGDNEALDTAWGTAQEVTDNLDATPNLNRSMLSAATPAITPAGTPAGGEELSIRVYRDPAHAGDTLAADARLLRVDLEYGVTQLSA